MAAFLTPNQTPVKLTERVLVTPRTSEHICFICNKNQERSSYRKRLFNQDGEPQEALLLSKQVLDICEKDILTRIMCKFCFGRIHTASLKVKQLKKDFSTTKLSLETNFATTVKKRLTKVDPNGEDKENSSGIRKKRSLGPYFEAAASQETCQPSVSVSLV